MNKSDLVKIIQSNSYFSSEQSWEIVNCIIEEISGHLAKRGRIEIRGFGSFFTNVYSNKFVRNPKTGQRIRKAFRTRVRFRVSPLVLRRLNDNKKTLAAIQELEAGKGTKYDSTKQMWDDI